MVWNQRLKGIGQLGRARSAIASQRNRTQSDDNLAHQRTVQIVTGSGEPGRGRRVRVDDAMHVRAQAVNQQMHADLARNSPLTGETSSVHVHNHHVGSAHPALADTSGSHQQVCFVETDGQVPVGGRNKTVFVQEAAELHNLEPMLAVVVSGDSGHREILARPCYSTPWKPYNH